MNIFIYMSSFIKYADAGKVKFEASIIILVHLYFV